MRDGLPALDLLRVFEACARLSSFTLAAAELGTTQPAVSQQIQRLEAQLGTSLFERVYRGIVLTPSGVVLLDHVQDALEMVRAGIDAVSAHPRRELLSVATDFAFAAYWLMPRLPRFYQLHSRTDISLVTSNRPLLALGSDIDLAIAFGDGRARRAESELLFREEVFPVCSPRLLSGRTRGKDHGLAGLPLLELKAAPGQHWFDWPGLFQSFGLGLAPARATPGFDNYTLVVGAALAGRGVAIGWRHLVDDLLEQGLLCPLLQGTATSSYGYHLLLPQRKRRIRVVRHFVDWLHAEMATPAVAARGHLPARSHAPGPARPPKNAAPEGLPAKGPR